ncbi:MAG TPA: carbohydrate kinase, partial [Chromatiales bacterium]|nr:carbohydrate kinase [Chromatiales bacterium]
ASPIDPPAFDGSGYTQEPTLWWDALLITLSDLFLHCDATQVSAMCVDGTSGTVLVINGQGELLGPALMYHDARAIDEAQQVAQSDPDLGWLGPSASLPKLLYLRAQHPTARYALHQADWIAARLTGQFGIADENNCLKMGYDAAARRWPESAVFNDLRALLPEVRPAGTLMADISPVIAERIGVASTVSIVCGTTDSTAAAIATQIDCPGQAVTCLGSTMTMKVLSETPIFSVEYGVYSHRIDDLWLVGGASNSGGAVLRHFFSQSAINQMTERLNPQQPTGLNYYPLVRDGERFPHADPAWAACTSPRPGDDIRFFQALLEGMAQIEAEAYRLLETLCGIKVTSITTSGGGSVNAAWQAIRQQIIGRPVCRAPISDAAYGAALLARRCPRDHNSSACV